jgi:hypothetical protein
MRTCAERKEKTMTTEITTTTSDLIIEKRDDGWRYLVMNGQELRWQPSDPMSKLQEFFRPLGYAAFISKDKEMDFYWTTTDLKITVETNGGCL